jgi:hypothetical protein
MDGALPTLLTHTPAGELNRAIVPMPLTSPMEFPATVDTANGCREGEGEGDREGEGEGDFD